ncbi:MAG TPA: hypothetical protein VJX31_04445 [Casimicrobiaceae bacterium]|nr:hypothetical protein [Casimicrobiaceae bacterium]
MRHLLIAFALALATTTSSIAQVNVSIGINVPVYPQLVRVPGYPVYYAPQLDSNYFFYDGMYWVYADDNWYASTWYNGPWELVAPDFVPLFILRVPVRYYRRAPVYFRGWGRDAPPRWGDYWGNTWYARHRGWDSWNRSAVPAPAPLPVYQRQYSGGRYPRAEQQVTLQTRNYPYSPRDATVRRQYETRQTAMPAATAPPSTSRAPSSPSRQNVAHPPDSTQARPTRNDMRAQPTPRMPQSQARDVGAPPAGAPPIRTQSARPTSARPAEQSVPPASRPPQSVERAARPPSNEPRGNAGNGEHRGNAGNAEQRGNGPNNAQRGNEQHGNDQRGRGGPPGLEKKND